MKILSSEGLRFYEKSISLDAVTKPYGGERGIIWIDSYENRDHLLRSLKKQLPDYLILAINITTSIEFFSTFLAKTKELIFQITKTRAY